jgi:PAS domain S-box-containing protein
MPISSADATLQGGGEMGALMRQVDWSRTSLGPVAEWPQSLRTAVSILLESRFPMYIAWGPGYAQLYNDGYRPILGSSKHPAAMGLGAPVTFAESWHIIGPMFDDVRRGIAAGAEDWMLPLDRYGYLEECYFTFSYSPIRDESGGVGGVHVTVTETTGRVLGERRLRLLHELSEQTARAKTPEEAIRIAASILEGARADVPFALFYLLSQDGETARLVAQTGLPEGSPARIEEIALSAGDDAGFPLGEAARSGQPQVVLDLAARFGALPGSPWPEPVHTAVTLSIARPGQERPYGLLVAGVSPRRELDKDYRAFFSLIANHVAAAEARREALERLQEAERLLRSLIDNLPVIAWSALPDGRADFFNQRWYEYTGTTAEQMGSWDRKLAHDPSMVDEVVARWQRSLQTGERFEMEFPLRGADGVFRWFLTRVAPLRDGQGRIVRWIGTNTDIHELRETRKRTEALLAEVSREASEMESAFRAMRAAKENVEQRLRELERERGQG